MLGKLIFNNIPIIIIIAVLCYCFPAHLIYASIYVYLPLLLKMYDNRIELSGDGTDNGLQDRTWTSKWWRIEVWILCTSDREWLFIIIHYTTAQSGIHYIVEVEIISRPRPRPSILLFKWMSEWVNTDNVPFDKWSNYWCHISFLAYMYSVRLMKLMFMCTTYKGNSEQKLYNLNGNSIKWRKWNYTASDILQINLYPHAGGKCDGGGGSALYRPLFSQIALCIRMCVCVCVCFVSSNYNHNA